ncbi:LIN1 transcriptase, partial [Crocuta crocuta]
QWFWHNDRYIDQWNRIESSEINTEIYTTQAPNQMIFDKGTKTIQCGKGQPFNKWCWKQWISICKIIKL